jgi:chromosomal replication initiation ATPase DnaA
LAGYNPLVIVGPAGSGKSRLVSEWFVNQGLEKTAGHKTPTHFMWDGRSLGRDLAAALSHNTIDRMHERFVSSRLIIVDGVEQIAAWDVQRALAHLFDAAMAAGTAFITTLRIHPTACTSLEASLASRLAGGLVVSMPPGNTTRSPADNADNDVSDSRPTTTLRRVIGATARKHGLTAADLTGPSRSRQVSHARGMAMYLSRRLTPASLGTIGTAFGGRDHTTVLHGIRVTEARRSLHPGIAAEIDQLIATLVRR